MRSAIPGEASVLARLRMAGPSFRAEAGRSRAAGLRRTIQIVALAITSATDGVERTIARRRGSFITPWIVPWPLPE